MKKLSIIFLILFSVNINAQTFIGLKAGLGLSNMHSSQGGLSQSLGTLTSFTGGIPILFVQSERFGIQPEINYVTKGYKEKAQLVFAGFTYGGEGSIKINCIEIPVLGKFSFREKKFDLNLLAGPSVAYGMNGKMSTQITGPGINNSETQNINFKDDHISRIDISLNLGIGLTFPRISNVYFFDIRYQVGFTNMNTEPNTGNVEEDVRITNSCFQITAGVFFMSFAKKTKTAR